MKKNKIYDCITFFDENLLVNARFEILKDVVDFFIICESNYDHKGNKKKINFSLINQEYRNKVKHIIIEENFPDLKNGWSIESYQREKIFNSLHVADKEDFIMYSDADEIPNPNILKDLDLKKKYGIFLQKFFVYKINIFNEYETPWQGTRICKKKNLKSFTHLRKKIRLENLQKPFWKIQYEKNIDILENGGWHFNNLYSPEIISMKLKNIQNVDKRLIKAHTSIEIIKQKILKLEDLFERDHKYKKIDIDSEYPEYIRNNLHLFDNWII